MAEEKVYEIGKRRGRDVPVFLGKDRRELPCGKPVVITTDDARVLEDAGWEVTELTEDVIKDKAAKLRAEAERLEQQSMVDVVKAKEKVAQLEAEKAAADEEAKAVEADPAAAAAWRSGDYQKRRKYALANSDDDTFASATPKSDELKVWFEDRLGIELGE